MAERETTHPRGGPGPRLVTLGGMSIRRLVLVSLGVLPLAAAAAEGGQVKSFEFVWSRVGETYPYADMGGVDWKAAHDELLPQAAAAGSPAELRPVVQRLFDRLPMSHYHIWGGTSYGEVDRLITEATAAGGGECGLEARRVEGRLLVTRLERGGAAEAAGVRPGWELVRLGKLDGAALLAALDRGGFDDALVQRLIDRAVSAAQSGAPGGALPGAFRDGTGAERGLTLAPTARDGVVSGFPGNEGMQVDVEDHADGDVRYFGFDFFVLPVPERFGAALAAAKASGAKGVVIDLRGNPGGVIGMAVGLMGFLVDAPGTSLGTMVTRGFEMKLPVSPRVSTQRYAGRVAVLIDDQSGSTSEVFAQGAKESGRARLFGQTSAGQAVASEIETLPNGDRFQLAIGDFVSAGGYRIDGKGVVPDQPVPLTRENLLAEGDPVYAAAAAWLRSAP